VPTLIAHHDVGELDWQALGLAALPGDPKGRRGALRIVGADKTRRSMRMPAAGHVGLLAPPRSGEAKRKVRSTVEPWLTWPVT
jgi:hypothetical protein